MNKNLLNKIILITLLLIIVVYVEVDKYKPKQVIQMENISIGYKIKGNSKKGYTIYIIKDGQRYPFANKIYNKQAANTIATIVAYNLAIEMNTRENRSRKSRN